MKRRLRCRPSSAGMRSAVRLNYRTVPLEIPGKMMLALGRIAMDQGISFSEFIEGILEAYLRQKKVHWKSG